MTMHDVEPWSRGGAARVLGISEEGKDRKVKFRLRARVQRRI